MWDIAFFVVLFGAFLVPSAIFKQWRLFAVFAVFFVCFGLLEWLSIAQTGQSISQKFWDLDTVNPAAGWVIVGGMALGWVGLLIHFKLHKKK